MSSRYAGGLSHQWASVRTTAAATELAPSLAIWKAGAWSMGLVLFPGFASFPVNQEGECFIKMPYKSVLFASSRIVMLQRLNTKADIL